MKMFNPPYPGEIIAETLDELSLSVRDLAKALHVAPSTAHRLVNGEAVLTPEMAIKLSCVLGSSARFWLNLQDSYSISQAEQKIDTSIYKSLVAA